MNLEVRHLRLVAAIVDAGSLTRAGATLHLTQSALSHQLRDIEERLETRLFHRVGKRLVATPAGQELLASARQVLDVMERTERGLQRHHDGGVGRLRISTACYTCYHWLPAVLKPYRAAHPGVDVQIDASATPHPLPHLLDGRIDLAILYERVRDRRVVQAPLFADDMVAVMAPTHALAARRFLAPRDFAGETLIIYPPKEESTFYQRVLLRAGVRPRLQQVQLTEAIVELAKAGLGVAVLARWAAEPHLRAGTLVARPVSRAGYRREWSAVVLRGAEAQPFVMDFIALLQRARPAPLRVAK